MFLELLMSTFVIDLSDRSLTFPDGEVITVAIGKDSTPTPIGTYYVDRIIDSPNGSDVGFLGSISIELLQETGESIAIHGTNDQQSIGLAVSKGCLRVAKKHEAKLSQTISFSSTVIVQP